MLSIQMVLIVALAALLAGCNDFVPSSAGEEAGLGTEVVPVPEPEPEPQYDLLEKKNVNYDTLPGTEQKLLSLDVYGFSGGQHPIVVGVHGGGWYTGDKASPTWLKHKIEFFNNLGFVFISVNYRLSPSPPTYNPPENRIKYPIHNIDVSKAVLWAREHAGEFGGDPQRLSLFGHSAGAGIVSLISTDERFLGAVGMGLSDLKCTVSLDTNSYNVAVMAPNSEIYQNAFAAEVEVNFAQIWEEASAKNYVAAGKGIPSFFMVSQNKPLRTAVHQNFFDSLQENSIRSELLIADLSHAEINQTIGDPMDDLVTPKLTEFLKTHCH